MKPSIGRIVIFNWADKNAAPLPAIIIQVVSENCVDLHVFGGHPSPLQTSVILAGTFQDYSSPTWDWPPRE